MSIELSEPQIPETSVELDAPRASDPAQSQHKEVPAEPEAKTEAKPASRMDALKQAEADLADKDAKAAVEAAAKGKEPAAEPEKDAKAEEAPAKDDAKADEAKPDETAKEDLKPKAEKVRHEPPAKFLPRAKELWANVPNEVKGEITRFTKEHEDEVAQYKEFTAPLVKYHQMAQQSGTTIHEALERYVNMEQALAHDPAVGFKGLLDNLQLQPTEAIGHILRAFNVTPQALAQHMSQQPEAYFTQAPRQSSEPRQDPQVAALQQQVRQMQEQQVTESVIAPFKAAHPRFSELQDDIAFFLQSPKIPQSLSPSDRLSAAYDMAVRINPTSHAASDDSYEDPASLGRAATNLNGKKSITGAPASGTETRARRRSDISRKDAIDAAMSELGLS